MKGYVFNIGNLSIPYDIESSDKINNVKVVVDINGMSVIVPKDFDDSKLDKILNKKSNWIYNSYNEFKLMKIEDYKRDWESGERILYKGRRYNLRFYKLDIDNVCINFDGKKFKVNIPLNIENNEVKLAFNEWFIAKAKKCILSRVKYYCKIIGVDYNRFTLREQRTRWGSCSKKGNLNFNWKIILAPQWVIDYVVVHEVCHLKHLNHSKDFWNMVALYIPDYLKAKKWLKKNGLSLTF